MTARHEVGDEVIVRWPDGPHDFVLEYYDDGPRLMPPPAPGWQYIRGVRIQPDGIGWRWMHTFYVRPVDGKPGVYELMRLPTSAPA